MDYVLCKHLKDAGFPQAPGVDSNYIRRTGRAPVYICEHNRAHYKCPTHSEVYVPHLRELIDACGDKFLSVELIIDGGLDGNERLFWASCRPFLIPESYQIAGETPEEAVANLWLNLNGK